MQVRGFVPVILSMAPACKNKRLINPDRRVVPETVGAFLFYPVIVHNTWFSADRLQGVLLFLP